MSDSTLSRLKNNVLLRRSLLVAAEIVGIVAIAAVVGAGVLYLRLTQGPINLALIKPQLEAALTKARNGRPVTLNRVTLEWSADRNRIEVAMSEIALYSGPDQQVTTTAKRASVILRADSLLFGRIEPLSLSLEDGSARIPAGGGHTALLDRAPRALAELRTLLFTYTLKSLELRDFTLTPHQTGQASSWSVSQLRTTITKRGSTLAISAHGQIVGLSEKPISISAGIMIDAEGASTSDGIRIADASFGLARLLPQTFPLVYDGVAEAEISFSASPEILETASLRLSAKNGIVRWKETAGKLRAPVSIDSVNADLTYVVADSKLKITALDLRSEALSGRLTADVDIGDPLEAGHSWPRDIAVEATASGLRVAIPQVFSAPATFKTVSMSAAFNAANQALNLTSARAEHADGFVLTGLGRASWPKSQDASPASVTASISMSAVARPSFTIGHGIGLMPGGVAPGLRDWMARHIKAGNLTSATLTINCPGGLLPLKDAIAGCIALDFAYAGAELHHIGALPPITAIKGQASFREGEFVADIASGTVNSWTIDSGRFRSPRLESEQKPNRVEIKVNGPLADLNDILGPIMPADCRPTESRRPTTGTGSADIVLDIYALAGGEVEFDISVEGKLEPVAYYNAMPGMHLTRADLAIAIRNRSVRISGAGLFDGSYTEMNWTNNLDQQPRVPGTAMSGTSSRKQKTERSNTLTARVSLSPDQLRRAGLPTSVYDFIRSGNTVIDVTMDQSDCMTDVAVAKLDLSGTMLKLPLPGWIKEEGEPASGAVRYGRNPGGDAVVTADIRASGLVLSADASLAPDGTLRLLSLERAYARDHVDVSGRVRPTSSGGYAIELRGQTFDAERFVDQIRSGSLNESEPIPIEASIAVTSLTKGDEDFLRDAAVRIETSTNGLQKMRISGRITSDGELGFSLDTVTTGEGDDASLPGEESDDENTDQATAQPGIRQQKKIKLRSDDAGRVLKVLTGKDILNGGEMAATGNISPGNSSLYIRVHKAYATNLPILAKVLSLASLRALSDALTEKGILFTDIEIPIRMAEGRVDLLNARASGPSLGVTASGWIVNETGELSLTGFIVPSFGINAALGGIPIIGDLFVSRSGEGIFAISYSVSGTLKEAKAKIEPLSLLTPGILRRAFENSPPPPTLAKRAEGNAAEPQKSSETVTETGDTGNTGTESSDAPTAPSRKPLQR